MKMDNISRFCFLVTEINKIQADLSKKEEDFYDGGHSFEEVYSYRIEELEKLKEELSTILYSIVGEHQSEETKQLFPNMPEITTNGEN